MTRLALLTIRRRTRVRVTIKRKTTVRVIRRRSGRR